MWSSEYLVTICHAVPQFWVGAKPQIPSLSSPMQCETKDATPVEIFVRFASWQQLDYYAALHMSWLDSTYESASTLSGARATALLTGSRLAEFHRFTGTNSRRSSQHVYQNFSHLNSPLSICLHRKLRIAAFCHHPYPLFIRSRAAAVCFASYTFLFYLPVETMLLVLQGSKF